MSITSSIKKIIKIISSNDNIIIQNGNIVGGDLVAGDRIMQHGYCYEVIVEGNVNNLNCGGSATVKGDAGEVDAGGSITVDGNVTGDLDAGGSIRVGGNVQGDLDAGGSIKVGGQHYHEIN